MAKNSLKVVTQNTTNINSAGYISIVDQLVVSQAGLDDFGGDEEDNGFTKWRTKVLVAYAATAANGTATNAVITQLDQSGAEEPVSQQNLRLRAGKDRRRTNANGTNRVTIPLPEEAIDVGASDYIDRYIEVFMTEWTGNAFTLPGTSNARKANARKFMFGAMLLTKCR